MNRKRILIYAVILLVLAVLVYLQFRTWRNFDWATFWAQTGRVNKLHIAAAIALIYAGYVVRALRWRIFLMPVRKTSTIRLIRPTLIGFTGLALLGRPGELIRPYLIARRENLSLSSQLAVWAVERIFDVGAFTLLLVLCLVWVARDPDLEYYQLHRQSFRTGEFWLVALVVALAAAAALVSWKGEGLAAWAERHFSRRSAHLGRRIALRIREFRGGLNTIHSPFALAGLIATSVGMWYMIALAYQQVTLAYGVDILRIPVSQVLLLMGSSMIGSIVQLPGVGGGSQLATIATLQHVFEAPHELAASCGIMLWVVTFLAVVPLGLALAHRERLSLRELSEESHRAEEVDSPAPVPPSAD